MTAELPPLDTLAKRVSWLISQAHRSGERSMSDREVADFITKVTGRKTDHNTIWKLRTGKIRNPSFELIASVARAFGIPVSWFSGDADESLAQDMALVVELRNLGINGYHFQVLLEADPSVRRAFITFLEQAGRGRAADGTSQGTWGQGSAAEPAQAAEPKDASAASAPRSAQ